MYPRFGTMSSMTAKSVPPYIPSDTDAAAFVAAAGLTDNTQRQAVDVLATSLKSASIWTKLDCIYPLVGGTATAHKFNLKNPLDTDAAFRVTWSGTVLHTAAGITGVNGYGDTHHVPSVDIPANEGSFGIYTPSGLSFGQWEIGSMDAGGHPFGCSIISGTLTYFGISGSSWNTTSPAVPGFWQFNKMGTDTTFKVNTLAKVVMAGDFYAASANSVVLCGINFGAGTGVVTGAGRTLSFAYIGNTLTDADVTAFQTIVAAYQTSLGR